MLTLYDRPVGTEVAFPIEGSFPSNTPVQVYKDGVATALQVTFTPVGVSGPTIVKLTPTSSGLYALVLTSDGTLAAYIDVVARTVTSYLKNIEDEALGSWTWNRTEGTLQLLRQDGSALADFAVADTQTESSRERLL